MNKKFIVELTDSRKKSINADSFEIQNGILIFIKNKEFIASLNQNTWIDCSQEGLWSDYNNSNNIRSEVEVLNTKNQDTTILEKQNKIENSDSLPLVTVLEQSINNEDDLYDKLLVDKKEEEEKIQEDDYSNDLSDVWQEIQRQNKEKLQKINDNSENNNLNISAENYDSHNLVNESENVTEIDDNIEHLRENELLESNSEIKEENSISIEQEDLSNTNLESDSLLDDLNTLENNLEDNQENNNNESNEQEEQASSDASDLLDDLNALENGLEDNQENNNNESNEEEHVGSDTSDLLDDLNTLENGLESNQENSNNESNEQEEQASSDASDLLDDLNALENGLEDNQENNNNESNEEEHVGSDTSDLLDDLNALENGVEDNQENNSESNEKQEEQTSSDTGDLLDDLNTLETSQEVNRKEYEIASLTDEDENIKNESISAITERDSIEELLSQLPSETYTTETKQGNREIHRVKASSVDSDLDALDRAILEKEKKVSKEKQEPIKEFRELPEAEVVSRRPENPMIRNSQGRLLTPQELKVKKEKIIEQTVGQFCTKFPVFNAVKLSGILNKNEKAKPYQITEDDIIWVAAKMIRNSDIDPKYFINEHEQKKLSYFLPDIMKNQWDGSIANLSQVLNEIPQLKTSTLIDISIWLLNNDYI